MYLHKPESPFLDGDAYLLLYRAYFASAFHIYFPPL